MAFGFDIPISGTPSATAFGGALSFATMVDQNRALMNQTALAGVRGLLESLDSAGGYTQALEQLNQTVAYLDQANELAANYTLGEADDDQVQSHIETARERLRTQADSLLTSINSQINSLPSGTGGGSAAQAASQELRDALISLRNAITALKNGTPNAASLVSQALQAVQAAKNSAQAAYDDANNDQKSAAQQVLNAANQSLQTASQCNSLAQSAYAQMVSMTPTVHDLGDGYTLATWGTSGRMTLIGPDGEGIIINSDGSVDALDGSGNGWKFATKGTFILPNDTKITITPGSPASVTVIRGNYHFSINNLKSGMQPETDPYSETGGRKVDEELTDGYIFHIGSDTSTWTLSGQPLNPSNGPRNVVATEPSNNEYPLDPTDIAIPDELKNFLEQLGFELSDYDGDGKFNDSELLDAAVFMDGVVTMLQEGFGKALEATAKAAALLFELNQMLARIAKNAEKNLDKEESFTPEEREAIQSLEKRLMQALEELRRIRNQNVQESSRPSVHPQGPSQTQHSQPSHGNSQTESDGASMLFAMRRAERLLGGRGHLHHIENQSRNSQINRELQEAIRNFARAADRLPSVLAALGMFQADGEVQLTQLSPLNLITGANALFERLAQLSVVGGLHDPQSELARMLLGATAPSTQEELALAAPALLAFMQEVSVLGTLGPNQPDLFEAQVQKVLAGLASLGSAGASQSSSAPQGAGQPTVDNPLGLPSDMNAGLLQLIAALAFVMQSNPGSFGAPPAGEATNNPIANISNTIGNQSLISNISKNFYTDPDLLQRIRQNLSQAQKQHEEDIRRAGMLFQDAQEQVKRFAELLKENRLIDDVLTDDRISDHERERHTRRAKELNREWGVDWGDDGSSNPSSESQLASQVVKSGMMI